MSRFVFSRVLDFAVADSGLRVFYNIFYCNWLVFVLLETQFSLHFSIWKPLNGVLGYSTTLFSIRAIPEYVL